MCYSVGKVFQKGGAGSTIFPFRSAEKGGLKCVIP